MHGRTALLADGVRDGLFGYDVGRLPLGGPAVRRRRRRRLSRGDRWDGRRIGNRRRDRVLTRWGLDRPRAKLQVALAVIVGVLLPGGSLLIGNGVFAWTMFSKSETYRMRVLGWTADGAVNAVDPRSLAPQVSPSIGYFLPAPDVWRHDPVGLTFRTGLGKIAELACRLGSFTTTEVTLEERANLDAAPKTSVAHARCR